MKKLNIEIDPMSAEEVIAIVQEAVNASPEVVAKAKAAMPKKAKKKGKKQDRKEG